MSIILQSSGGGSVTIAEPATASNFTQTLPAATGTVMVSGNQPAFSAFGSTLTTCSNNAFTKILFQTEDFDTNNNFASSTFTPTVAGYYQVSAAVSFGGSGAATNTAFASLYKNGSRAKDGNIAPNVSSVGLQSVLSYIMYMNGTTDTLEIYAFQNSGGNLNTAASSAGTYFGAILARSA